MVSPPSALQAFSPAVRAWFRERLGPPTPPQAEGWPAIQRGEHTLILAPTGSGKTLAAFLWGIDELYREAAAPDAGEQPDGVRLLYVSPLKALNNDIERNLRVPLEGIRAVAARQGQPLPALRVAVRTGDTPASVRAQMLKHPPHILITTPESLYLMLTSPRARDMFRTVRSVIVDEIHTLVGNKRGAHLALSLERLAALATGPVQRIGLSATIRPLEEAAHFLGGQAGGPEEPLPRPVTIVNASYRKALQLEVITAVDDFRDLPGKTIWPAVIPRVLDDIRRHTTTLIFANNRRLAERTADRLNAQLAAEQSEEIPPGSTEALAPGGLAHDRGMFAIGAPGPIRAHHGSMSKDARLSMEEDLKAGRLPALVATSSLELGIDIGAVDVVVQLQSPKSVARGLQRVGRSGHLVGQTSQGRIYATFREDLMEAAAIARGMLEGAVELTCTPQNPLDVLAQQIVAMVAMDDWLVDDLFAVVLRAYPYHALPRSAFIAVLDMLTGKYFLDMPSGVKGPAAALRPKIAWDRVNDRLTALPGSKLLALNNSGTIPDTGAYAVYLGDGKTRLGELDEEFVLETRVGDAFLLGSNVWRVTDINDDRLLVTEAAGATPRMPFWNGDYPYRPYELGARIGRFRREIVSRVAGADPAEVEAWLRREYVLDESSARNLVAHVRRQIEAVGVISSDTTIIAESFQNAAGEHYLVIHSPFGGRVNGAWALALMSVWRELLGVTPEAQTNDDGLIFRLPASKNDLPAEVIRQMTPQAARDRLLRELPQSAVFGARFRMNAGRALLLPRTRAGKRTPFWLQRLRAKELLAHVGRLEDFPIVAETMRDVLQDVFDLPHLEELLTRIQQGEIQVVSINTVAPSPVAASLLYNFVSVFLYEWDAPKAEQQLQALSLTEVLTGVRAEGATLGAADGVFPGADLSDLLRPEAIREIVQRAQHRAPGYQARTLEELAFVLRELGDQSTYEVATASAGDGGAWLAELGAQGRVVPVTIGGEQRWVPVELETDYRASFTAAVAPPKTDAQAMAILRRFLRHAGPVTRAEILARYPWPDPWLDSALAHLARAGEIVPGCFTAPGSAEYMDAHTLDMVRRRTLALLRQEVQPVSLFAYANFLARWQHAHPAARLSGTDALRQVLVQLRGLALPVPAWEREVLPARLTAFDARDLDALTATGELIWVGVPTPTATTGADPDSEPEARALVLDPRRRRVRLFFRGEGALFVEPPGAAALSAQAQSVCDLLKAEGASFAADLQAGLGLTLAALNQALAELVAAGLVTHDTLEPMRSQLLPESGVDRQPLSALEQDLAARRGYRPRTLTPSRYRAAKARVSQRLQEHFASQPAPMVPGGRWSLVQRAAVLGPPLTDAEGTTRQATLLLARCGVVSRESLERENLRWDWARLYPIFQRLELRGGVRRGYFVEGLSGAQFALPEAVEALRRPAAGDEEVVVLAAADPANIFGGEYATVDTPRFARVPSTHVALAAGQPVVVFEDNGGRIATQPDTPPVVIERAVAAYMARPYAPRRIVVNQWNGRPVVGSDGQPVLQALGFHNTPGGMEYWASP